MLRRIRFQKIILLFFTLTLLECSESEQSTVSINLIQLDVIVELFEECDIFIFSEAELWSLHTQRFPFILYRSASMYKSHFTSNPYFHRPPGRTTGYETLFTRENYILPTRPRNCKAQIHIIWKTKRLMTDGTALFSDYFQFQIWESTFVYSVLVSPAYAIKNTDLTNWQSYCLDMWTPSCPPQLLLRTLRFRFPNHVDLRYFYVIHIKRTRQWQVSERRAKGKHGVKVVKIRLASLPIPYYMRSFSIVDLYSKEHTASGDWWWNDGDYGRLDGLERVRELTKEYGTITAQEVTFAHFHRRSTVIVRKLTFKSDNDSDFYTNISHELEDIVKERGKKAVLVEHINYLIAEFILIVELMAKYPNMTLFPESNIIPGAFKFIDYISGPSMGERVKSEGGSYRPVTERSIGFFSCHNVRQKLFSVRFYAPFDTITWICIAFISFLITAILSWSVKADSRGWETYWRLLMVPWRVLLVNYDALPPKLLNQKPAFRTILLLFWLSGILMSNLYSGVITADLTSPPNITGPQTFNALLAANTSMYLDYHIEDPDGNFDYQLTREMDHLRISLGTTAVIPVLSQEYYKINATLASIKAPRRYESGIGIVMQCQNTALLQFSRQLGYVSLDAWHKRVASSKRFVLGKEHIARGTSSWSSLLYREGPAYKMIVRYVEGGIFQWTEQRLQDLLPLGTKMIRVDEAFRDTIREAPLTIYHPIVFSTLALCQSIIVISLIVLLIEFVLFGLHKLKEFVIASLELELELP